MTTTPAHPTDEQLAREAAEQFRDPGAYPEPCFVEERKEVESLILTALARKGGGATLKEVTDFSWAVGSIEGVLHGVRTTKTLLPNQVEAIDDALKQIAILKRLAPLHFSPSASPLPLSKTPPNDHP